MSVARAEARKYAWVAFTSARASVAYLGEVVTSTVFLAVILFIFLQLWRVTFASSGAARLGGLSLEQMLWYLAMTEAITLSRPRLSAAVDEDVRTGGVAVQLMRPLSYPLYRVFAALGERLVSFALKGAVGAAVAFALVGPIPFTAPGLALFAASIPVAFTADLLAFLIVGLGAFWFEDTSGLVLLYSRVTMILGGMLLPLELFPAAAQPVLRALPFSSLVYGPARAFVHPDAAFVLDLLARQAAALVALAGVAWLLYRSGVRRIHANGG